MYPPFFSTRSFNLARTIAQLSLITRLYYSLTSDLALAGAESAEEAHLKLDTVPVALFPTSLRVSGVIRCLKYTRFFTDHAKCRAFASDSPLPSMCREILHHSPWGAD